MILSFMMQRYTLFMKYNTDKQEILVFDEKFNQTYIQRIYMTSHIPLQLSSKSTPRLIQSCSKRAPIELRAYSNRTPIVRQQSSYDSLMFLYEMFGRCPVYVR